MMTTPAPEFRLEPGVLIDHQRQRHVVMQILDAETVLLRNLSSGGVMRVAVSELNPQRPFTHLKDQRLDLMLVKEDPWEVATSRHQVIEPLLGLTGRKRTQAMVQERADLAGVHVATIYRWLDLYEASGKIDVLLPRARKDRDSYKLGPQVEKVVQEVIDELYLNRQKRGVQSIVTEVQRRCEQGGIPKPHYNTVRKRIKDRSAYLVAEKRLGKKAADDLYAPNTAPFPGEHYPMSLVQMDHVQLDLELVDDIEGLPIGRAWLTVMICARTRMIPGFWLGLDSPNSFSVGMCVANAVLPKDELLSKYNVNASWPIQGFPRLIHTDNAREFHSEALERACAQYGLSQEYRPRGRPEFGAYIERMVGNVNDWLKEEPGTTFSNPTQRGSYDSAKHAAYTLSRLEEWIVRRLKIYHGSYHRGISTTPLQQFLNDVQGSDERPGTGLRVAQVDPYRLRLDFMPFFTRAMHDYGVQFELHQYYHDVLKHWINAKDPENPQLNRQFLFRYDPRDMSRVYFFDPDLKEYFVIPTRDTSFPVLSRWEARAAKRHRRKQGKAAVNAEEMRVAHEELQELRDTSTTETKQRRRARQKKRATESVVPADYFAPPVVPKPEREGPPESIGRVSVKGFEEVDF